MKNRSFILSLLSVVLLFSALITITLILFSSKVKEINQKNLESDFQLISEKNNEILSDKLSETSQSIQLVSKILSQYDNPLSEEAIVNARSLLSLCHFARIGIADRDGNAIVTDGINLDVSERAYFKQALAGKTYISDVFVSNVSNDYVISFSTPLYIEGLIWGVVYGIVKSESFNDYVDFNSDNVESYIFTSTSNEAGGILVGDYVSYPNSGIFSNDKNFFDSMNGTKILKKTIIDDDFLSKNANSIGSYEFIKNGVRYFGTVERVTKMGSWYIFTCALASDINTYLLQVDNLTKIMIASICLSAVLIIVGLFVIFYFIAKRHTEITNEMLVNAERLKIALKLTPNLIFDYDFNEKAITYQSDNFQFFDALVYKGHLPEALFSLDVIDSSCRDAFMENYNNLLNGAESCKCSFLVHQNGINKWFDLYAYKSKTFSEKRYTCVLIDVTEDKMFKR